MNTEIYFTIKAETDGNEDEIEFMIEYDQEGNSVEWQSFNPMNGWTNYNGWHQGWSTTDEYEEILDAINRFSNTYEVEELVSQMEKKDIDKEFITEIGEFTFTVICTHISLTD